MATFASRGKASCDPSRFLPQQAVRKDSLLSGFQAGPEKEVRHEETLARAGNRRDLRAQALDRLVVRFVEELIKRPR